ncbi:DUF5615 family PIN-like protein [Chroococcus sp. FPU101]|uniref:DUF5615 family PIN-like protein n=1 Tax=Chroococcus sp. FPU101 TaxID=1974212 RepID=UPI001A8D77F0|nr:DUF5615 family PIN-like protein [Chroococcus sp. FPU101]GFE72331.1 hypothetical protein CFPU101_49410 [Chroococcus sp. FPU101]
MKILIDMNLSPDWVATLAKYRIESVHWSTIGDFGATDRVIMEWAVTHNYIILTNDLDFGAILASSGATSPSVIQIRTQDLFPESLENELIKALNQFQEQLQEGALITIDLNRSKIRVLPINKNN